MGISNNRLSPINRGVIWVNTDAKAETFAGSSQFKKTGKNARVGNEIPETA
jgi:hypothetical protein